ncbi:MAG: TolC family protein [Candidatus Hydrogenedentes bacterium]|nr:TolC family protein [Candidatus Hydrogenedentota bacterium]
MRYSSKSNYISDDKNGEAGNISATKHPLYWGRISLLIVSITTLIFGGCTTLSPTETYLNSNVISENHTKFCLIRPRTKPKIPVTPDPLPTKTGPFSLNECIDLALKKNPGVAANAWDVKTAAAEKCTRSAKRWPRIHLTGDYFHYEDVQRLVPPSAPGKASYYTDDIASANLTLQLPIYAGGTLVNEIRSAALLTQSAEHTLARTRKELIFNVSSMYYGILAQRHVIKSLEFSYGALEQHVERVQNFIAAQKAAKVDALRTGVRLADIEQQLLRERNTLSVHMHVLSNFIGIEAKDFPNFDISGDLTLCKVEEEERDISLALTRRSDYAAAAAALEAQARKVDVARGNREPKISIEAAYGGRWGIGDSEKSAGTNSHAFSIDKNGNPSVSHTSPLSGGGSLTPTFGLKGFNSLRYSQSTVEDADSFEEIGKIGITVDIPLFEGGRIRAAIAREYSRLHAMQQRLRQLELQIQLEFDTASLNLDSARKRVEVTSKSISEAKESLRIEREKYDYGKGTILDVLDAQSALLNTQVNYYQALRDHNIGGVELRLALGKIGIKNDPLTRNKDRITTHSKKATDLKKGEK